nr:hypothetical protein GCM10025699_43970 [Microbacterium flavescens]
MNQTTQIAPVRRAMPGPKSCDTEARVGFSATRASSAGRVGAATPAASSKPRTVRSASSWRPLDSRNRTDSGMRRRTKTA